MTSYLSKLNPVPSFPEFPGPYQVGTVDIEVPISEIESPSPAPEGSKEIQTVLFRIFYPAVSGSGDSRTTWLPEPQRLHIASYAGFLGAGPTVASILSFLPRHLHWTTIPAWEKAKLLPCPPDRTDGRWPVMVFSHGLGGNRNTYSHITGSLASHGMIVVCPEHRDGSAAFSVIQDPRQKQSITTVPYVRIPHEFSAETWAARNKQFRIRLWELGMVFESLVRIDRGTLKGSNSSSPLAQFTGVLDIHRPGRVTFAGHSFGAATMVQLLKSTFYVDHPSLHKQGDNNNKTPPFRPLFTPSPTSSLVSQVTPATPTVLLDMWCFPLLAAETAALHALPLPCYAADAKPTTTTENATTTTTAPLIAIESAAFYAWPENLHLTALILSPPEPQPQPPHNPSIISETSTPKPLFFHVPSSAHLSQSDFGLLFPRLTRRAFKAAQSPDRVLRLNVRAVLQFLRGNGVPVAGTGRGVLRREGWVASSSSTSDGRSSLGSDSLGSASSGLSTPSLETEWVDDDAIILQAATPGKEVVAEWKWIDITGLGDKAPPSEWERMQGKGEDNNEKGEKEMVREVEAEVGEKEMQVEIEPSLGGGGVKGAVAVGVDGVSVGGR
ncbi:platelet-activating factor acetylhydrolase, isoform II-domain-containing protein [Dichotomopilus funicola]|uniref:Putative phospholipase n=1 Tax=Dichotomopilus funicola TaxID=1934379 RepID=A0AAN6VBX1_9PEZI|nr:platelet-activating factor acetylhydrolase, isoform II-domain-containing protein [Dichotomopilus funicola]